MIIEHFTYGYHPAEIGYSIKAYSNKDDVKFYDEFLSPVIDSIEYTTLETYGEARILYLVERGNKKKVMFSLVNNMGRRQDGVKGKYSHNLIIDLEDFLECGANPKFLEKYFWRDINARGKVDPIQIQTKEFFNPPNKIENYIGNKTNLKRILSSLLRGEKLKIVYASKNTSDLIELPYLLLEFLPKKQRLIPYVTLFPSPKKEEYFNLIVLPYKPADYGNYRVLDVRGEISFTPKDAIDKVVDEYIVDQYFKSGYDGLKNFHERWDEVEKESRNKDVVFLSESFINKIEIKVKDLGTFIKEAKSDFETGNFPDAERKARYVIENIKKVSQSEQFDVFLLMSQIILEVADNKQEGFDTTLKDIMTKAVSIFQEKQQLEILIAINRKFPKYKNEISQYSKRINTAERVRYISEDPTSIDSLDIEELGEVLKHPDSSNLPLNAQMNGFYKYFKEAEETKIISDLEVDEFTSTPIYKALVMIYKHRDSIRSSEYEDAIKLIIPKIIDFFDRAVHKPFFPPFISHPRLKGISYAVFYKLLSSDITILLLCLMDDFDLKGHTEKLKKAVQKSYEANLDVLFSPSALKSLRFILEKYER